MKIDLQDVPIFIYANGISINSVSVSTVSIITIRTEGSLSISNSNISSRRLYIYSVTSISEKKDNGSILITGSQLETSEHVCKSDCLSTARVYNPETNTANNKDCPQLFPVVSLLADAANGSFNITSTLRRYGLQEFEGFIEITKNNFTSFIITSGELDFS